MAIFVCKVVTPQGQIIKVKIEEKDKISCTKKLKRNGMTPIEIKETFIKKQDKNKKVSAKIYSRREHFSINKDTVVNIKNKVSAKELLYFTESFYVLKQSGFTDAHALSTIINNTEHEYFKNVLRELLQAVEGGNYMYRTMRNHLEVFPIVYINFIKTGEHTNTLKESLKYAITYLEDDEKIKDKLENTLVPNIIMFFVIIIATFLALAIGVPKIQSMISLNGGSVVLPKVTLIISKILRGFAKYWYIFTIIIVGMICVIIRYINTDDGKFDLDELKYTNRLFGKTMYLMDFSRVIKSVYLNLKNNMRIQDALEISKNVTKNTQMHDTIEKALNNLYVGKPWLNVFQENHILSSITIELLKKGFREKSIEIIERTIGYLDKEVEDSINSLLNKLSGISYLIIGIAVVLFIILVLIPYLQIYLSGLLFLM